MSVTVRRETGKIVRVQVTGEVDMSNAGQIVTAAQQVITAAGPGEILIDLSAATFLDAAGITALLTSRRAADHHGVRLRVVHPRGVVRRVLTITDMLDTLGALGP